MSSAVVVVCLPAFVYVLSLTRRRKDFPPVRLTSSGGVVFCSKGINARINICRQEAKKALELRASAHSRSLEVALFGPPPLQISPKRLQRSIYRSVRKPMDNIVVCSAVQDNS